MASRSAEGAGGVVAVARAAHCVPRVYPALDPAFN